MIRNIIKIKKIGGVLQLLDIPQPKTINATINHHSIPKKVEITNAGR